jgi:succinyl-diaminopimelate desuccinylase
LTGDFSRFTILSESAKEIKMSALRDRDKVIRAVEATREEMIDFLQQMVRIDTVAPPGNNYRECAKLIHDTMKRLGYDARFVEVPTDYFEGLMRLGNFPIPPEGLLPRVNVFARKEGSRNGKVMHFTGHFDVVPPGAGWTIDPFSGAQRNGRVYGRGSTDQKSGIAASLFAIEAIRRAGVALQGAVEQSATVDEEWIGEAGLGYLVAKGLIGRGMQDFVVITECLDVDGICLGHRGALFFDLVTRGKVGHGCMPQLAVNAVNKMASVMGAISAELQPRIESRVSRLPIMPEGSRRSSISPIWIDGAAFEKPGATIPALCTSFWNRWFNPEESLGEVRKEIIDFLDEVRKRDPELSVEIIEHYSAEPVAVSRDSELVKTYQRQIASVLGREGRLVLSPGFDDQRFVVVNGKIDNCILHGPGVLSMAHAPDEYVPVDDLVNAAGIMALSTLDLLNAGA